MVFVGLGLKTVVEVNLVFCSAVAVLIVAMDVFTWSLDTIPACDGVKLA